MRILWTKAGKLLPVDTGGKIRSYHLLRHLAAGHDVTLLSYYGGARDEAYEAELRERFPGAVPLHTGALDGSTAVRALDYAFRMFTAAPYAVAKFAHPAVKRLIDGWDRERRFDVSVCDFLSASLNFSRPVTPTVLFQHNVESVLWRRQAETATHPVKRWVAAREAAKMARYERDALGRFDHVIAVSDPDRDTMRTMYPAAAISVVPTGVDVDAFRPRMASASTGADVLFLGSMDWEPNIDGVQWFAADIWPRIRAAVPRARFRIVGRNPPPSIRQLAGDDIEVTGRVPSVQEHLHRAAVVVVPLRVGGGTRLKIYEAMAAAKAVVSTRIGAEGLDVTDGQDIALADTPKAFATSVIRLVEHREQRAAMESAALALASRYDWPRVADAFAEVLARVTAARAASSTQAVA